MLAEALDDVSPSGLPGHQEIIACGVFIVARNALRQRLIIFSLAEEISNKGWAMVQVRKLVLAIAAASALSSGMAQALGLGD